MIAAVIRHRTKSGLQAHPPLSALFSLHMTFRSRLVCKNRAILHAGFDPIGAFHDPSRSFPEFLHVRSIVLLHDRDRVA